MAILEDSPAPDTALQTRRQPTAASTPRTAPPPPVCGRVYLVGAGPGDPELLTVKGLRCLRRAHVVVYDRLVHPALLDEAPPLAERIYVGKKPGSHRTRQEDIQALLVSRALDGAVVVRLKGGDPFVFGRGGEEAAACAAAGVPWEVVPGVSSAVAAPASAAIPVTHRGVAASFTVVTAHRARGNGSPDWPVLARLETLVILMGVSRLPEITAQLIRHGRDPATPVAIVERGTLEDGRVIAGDLATITLTALEADVRPPATIVVGEVAALRGELLGDELREVVRESRRAPAETH